MCQTGKVTHKYRLLAQNGISPGKVRIIQPQRAQSTQRKQQLSVPSVFSVVNPEEIKKPRPTHDFKASFLRVPNAKLAS